MKCKPGLEYYNATREEWKQAYRYARTMKSAGLPADSKKQGIHWKAFLIVYNERERVFLSTADKLFIIRLTDEILDEITKQNS